MDGWMDESMAGWMGNGWMDRTPRQIYMLEFQLSYMLTCFNVFKQQRLWWLPPEQPFSLNAG